MITGRLRRRALALSTLFAAFVLFGTVAPQAAVADTTRTLNVAVSCASGIVPFGLQVNNGSGWYYPNGSSYAVGGTKYFTVFIPSSATGVALDTLCYYNSEEYNGTVFYPSGTWQGYGISITAGTSTVNMNALCAKYPVSPGPWVRTCTISGVTYS